MHLQQPIPLPINDEKKNGPRASEPGRWRLRLRVLCLPLVGHD